MPWPSLVAAALVLPVQLLAVGAVLALGLVPATGVGLLPLDLHPVLFVPAQLGLLAIPLVAAWLSPEPLRARLGLVAKMPYNSVPWAILGAFASTQAALFAFCLLRPDAVFGVEQARLHATAPSALLGWGTVLAASLLPAIGEELLFRGFLLRGLNKAWGPIPAVLLSALLFGLAHGVDASLPGRLGIGLVLGFAAVRTGSVRPGMVAHGVNNLLYIGWQVWLPFGWASALTSTGHSLALGLSLSLVLLSLLRLRSARPSPVDSPGSWSPTRYRPAWLRLRTSSTPR